MADRSALRQRVAVTYAQALLEVGAAGGNADALLEELAAVVKLVEADARFAQFLTSPIISAQARRQSLQRIFQGRLSRPLLGLLLVLCDHQRLGLLGEVLAAGRRLRDESLGRKPVQVRSAVPLDPGLQETIRLRLAERLGLEPLADFQVDPDLLGGLVIQVDDKVVDGSVRTRLRRLRDQILVRSRHEIQSR